MKTVKFLFLFLFLLSATTQVKAELEPKVVGSIVERAQVNQFTSGNYWGYQYYSTAIRFDLSASDINNLALKMSVYVENFDNPTDLTPITSAGFDQIEFASDYNITGSVKYLVWKIKALNLQPGWQDITLPFPTGNNAGIDLSKINFFRFCLAQIFANPGAFQIRIKDVKVVDLSQMIEPSVTPPVEWETDHLVSDVPFTMEGTYSAGGFAVGKKLEPAIDASKHNPAKLALQMDIDVDDLDTPGDISILSKITGQVELTSGGGPDQQELSWGITSLNWKPGKSTYTLYLSSASASSVAGSPPFNPGNINYIRLYGNGAAFASYTGHLKIKVDNVKIIDLTNETKLPTLFSDGMIFQQNKDINVWGYSQAGKPIKVEFYKNDIKIDEKETVTAESGKWTTTFAPLAGSYDKYKLVVLEDGVLKQTVNDILIGEVWLAAGQSNMAYGVSGTPDAAEVIAAANNNNIRFFLEPTWPTSSTVMPYEPVNDIPGAYWGAGDDPAQVGKFSAVAYHMALNLQPELKVPIGIINAAIGGSVIEAWLPREEVEADANLVFQLKRKGLYFNEEWWADGGTTLTCIYNQKVAPLAGYNIKGTIWYQGESNSGRADIYGLELDAMQRGYERLFGFTNNDMPFIFSQVCPWLTDLANPQFLGYLAETMTDAWKLHESNTAMLPLYDLDLTYDTDPIHPINKTPVGKRFAVAAKNLVYGDGQKEYTAPVFESLSVADNKVTVKFSHVGDGLQGIDGATDIHGFAISRSDGVYVNAKAKIVSKDEVEVWNDRITDPVNVTYAFATFNTNSNLANSTGIPASPFRTNKAATGQKYFNAQDWTYADADVWGGYNNGTKDVIGFMETWKKGTVSGQTATVKCSYDEANKTEGKASLKVDYTPDKLGIASVTPVLTNLTVLKQFDNFKTISVDILNPDDRDKELELFLKGSSATLYRAPIADQKATSNLNTKVKLKAGAGFTTFTFDISRFVVTNGNVITTQSTINTTLKSLTNLQFTINDTQAGTIQLDNILFGLEMKDELGIEGAKNDNSQISIGLLNQTITVNSTNELIRKIDVLDLQGRVISSTSPNQSSVAFKAPTQDTIVIVKVQTANAQKTEKLILK
ncbi:sialate O-acetylesterase [Viscerimonas tarda]